MRLTRDIHSLSDFKQNASKFVKQVQETKEPLVLTVNGKPAVVVQDAESYQEMRDSQERAENAAILRKRLAHVRSGGKLIPAEDAFVELSKKYGVKFDEPGKSK
jgi:prevent-host-death family protein